MDGGIVGQSCIWKLFWTESLVDRVYNGQNWFGWSPWWTGMQLDRKALGNYVWTESLMDRFYNGQSWFGKSPGWPGVHLDRIVF